METPEQRSVKFLAFTGSLSPSVSPPFFFFKSGTARINIWNCETNFSYRNPECCGHMAHTCVYRVLVGPDKSN